MSARLLELVVLNLEKEKRIVLTLDAGGTNFVFSALQGKKQIVEPYRCPSNGDNLPKCLDGIVEGFTKIKKQLGKKKIAAISFAFPGPADYLAGIIGKLNNMPAFKGGVALGPMLADEFKVPVFINNDGNLFALGEALFGMLPFVNGLLERAGNPKRFHNILGLTFGTGFGAGFVRNGQLWLGDNGASGEIFLMRNRTVSDTFVEDSVSIRAVKRTYAVAARILRKEAPEPAQIFKIAVGRKPGNKEAAKKAFTRMAVAAADAIANSVTMLDSLVVIGGGLSGASEIIIPVIVDEMNGSFERLSGERHDRLVQRVFALDDAASREEFLRGEVTTVKVPRSGREITYDPLKRTAVGVTRMGTSEAIAMGAYAFAIHELDKEKKKKRHSRKATPNCSSLV